MGLLTALLQSFQWRKEALPCSPSFRYIGTTMTEHISSSDLVGALQHIKFCTELQSHNHIIYNKPEECTNSLLCCSLLFSYYISHCCKILEILLFKFNDFQNLQKQNNFSLNLQNQKIPNSPISLSLSLSLTHTHTHTHTYTHSHNS